jgi:hypothetical protein
MRCGIVAICIFSNVHYQRIVAYVVFIHFHFIILQYGHGVGAGISARITISLSKYKESNVGAGLVVYLLV